MAVHRVDGLALHYEVHGAGPPVILLHGYCAGRAMWRHQIPPLAERFRVIAYDARGHGASDAPEGAQHYALERFAGDLHALLDALGIQRAHLVGHSMGGATVAAFAATWPERVLSTLICNIDAGHQVTDPDTESRNRALGEWKLACAAAEGMQALARQQIERGLVPRFVTESAEERTAYLERYRDQPLAGYLGVGSALPWREPWLAGAARSLHGPVGIIAGAEDPLHAGARRLHERLAGSRFVLLAKAPHDSMNARPGAFNQELLDFLDTVARGDAVGGRIIR